MFSAHSYQAVPCTIILSPRLQEWVIGKATSFCFVSVLYVCVFVLGNLSLLVFVCECHKLELFALIALKGTMIFCLRNP